MGFPILAVTAHQMCWINLLNEASIILNNNNLLKKRKKEKHCWAHTSGTIPKRPKTKKRNLERFPPNNPSPCTPGLDCLLENLGPAKMGFWQKWGSWAAHPQCKVKWETKWSTTDEHKGKQPVSTLPCRRWVHFIWVI